jgi:23S rRNA G2069 N7-methylase RlmK/C1962 C5-methylase RlmI
MAKDLSEQMMAESKTNLQLANETRDQYRTWYEDTLSALRQRNGAGETANA